MNWQTSKVSRRNFLNGLFSFSIASTIVGMIAPIVAYLLPPIKSATYAGPTMIGTVMDFPTGSGRVVEVNGKPVIIVNTAAGGIKAFSAIYTHLGCVVDWKKEKNVIH